MKKWLQDVELSGDIITLRPLTKSHHNALIDAASDGNLWELWYTSVPSENTIANYIHTALDQKKNNRALPFVVEENRAGKIIGSTRFCRADVSNKRLEIGFTWYAKRYHGTDVNPECKLLLLSYAFEELSAIAVEFRTHWHNIPSRRAIKKLGAKQDGVLRNHRIDPDGSYRDTVVYSIIKSEWPTVKKALKYRLQN